MLPLENESTQHFWLKYLRHLPCFFSFQAEYNAISYSDQMRLRTAVELLKATNDIESQLEEVTITCTYSYGVGFLVLYNLNIIQMQFKQSLLFVSLYKYLKAKHI